jgi:three-Cys-motif partner protein
MKKSQQTMLPHSEVKIDLLKKYLERYLNILTQSKYISDINIYDLFCGEGVYENGGKGSPIIILETIKDIYFAAQAKGKSIDKFNCKFNDIEDWKLDNLKQEITTRHLHYPAIGEIKFSQSDYRRILPEVINEINALKKEKAFVFIDPYGYKDVRISDIKNLLKSKKSEVLLFLPTQFMFRFENKGTPECLLEFIDELMPVDQWPASETGLDFIENLTDRYIRLGRIIGENVCYFELWNLQSNSKG